MQPAQHVRRNRLQRASAGKQIYLHVLLIYLPFLFFKLGQLQQGRETSLGGAVGQYFPPPWPRGLFGFLLLQDEITKLRAALERLTSAESCVGGAGAWEHLRQGITARMLMEGAWAHGCS